jgi:alkylation response protein AidB-like acyl-CoA dehydrogenase
MDFRLNEDQLSLQKAAREFLSKECTTVVVRSAFEGPDGSASELYKKMADLGWLALAVPEEDGGLGMGLVELAVLLEQMGYYDAPGPFFSTVAMAIPTLLKLGAKDKIESLIDGTKAASLVTDPDYVLDGQLADVFIVSDGGKVRWVDKGDAKVTPHQTVDGTRRTATVEVSSGAGEEIGDASALDSVIDAATALLSAESTGGMQRALDMTVDYVKVRTQFGRVIGSFQALKHRLADALLKTESAKSASYYAAWANDAEAEDAQFASSVAKAYVSDAFLSVAGECIQMHGGIGYTWEHDAHLWFKRATTNAALLGSAEFHRARALDLALQKI